jgi:hypothetical protein
MQSPPPCGPLVQSSGSGYGENLAAGSAYRACAPATVLWLGGKGSFKPGSADTPPRGESQGNRGALA